ncbi:MAG: hypothetical protein AB8G11_25495 [Saprospiraceae bacterium]
MIKQVRIVKKGEDDSNIKYWLSLSYNERMAELEKIRQYINNRKYGTGQGLQRVYRVIKRS